MGAGFLHYVNPASCVDGDALGFSKLLLWVYRVRFGAALPTRFPGMSADGYAVLHTFWACGDGTKHARTAGPLLHKVTSALRGNNSESSTLITGRVLLSACVLWSCGTCYDASTETRESVAVTRSP